MNELHLERSEFLILLDAVHTGAVIGIAREHLFPQDMQERKAVLKQGMVQLERHGLLQQDHSLHPDLLRLARIVAYPQIALIVIRHVQALGPQLFLFYHSEEGFVEQTFPTEGTHRLAVIRDIHTLLTRAVQILSLPEQLLIKGFIEIDQKDFFHCNSLAQQNRRGSALEILHDAGMPFFEADALVAVMQEPYFRGEVALLKCANPTIIDARDIAIIQNQKAAWYTSQIFPGKPLLRVESVNTLMMHSLLSQLFVELAQTP